MARQLHFWVSQRNLQIPKQSNLGRFTKAANDLLAQKLRLNFAFSVLVFITVGTVQVKEFSSHFGYKISAWNKMLEWIYKGSKNDSIAYSLARVLHSRCHLFEILDILVKDLLLVPVLLSDASDEIVSVCHFAWALYLFQRNFNFGHQSARLKRNCSFVNLNLQKSEFVRFINQNLNRFELFPNRDLNYWACFIFAHQTSTQPISHCINLNNSHCNKIV